MGEGILKLFGKAFVPEQIFNKPVRANLRKYLLTAGYNDVPYSLFGLLFLITAAITYMIFLPFVYPLFAGKFFILGFYTNNYSFNNYYFN